MARRGAGPAPPLAAPPPGLRTRLQGRPTWGDAGCRLSDGAAFIPFPGGVALRGSRGEGRGSLRGSF